VTNVAVIGIGKFGYYHAEKYSQMPRVNLILADKVATRAESAAVKLGATYTDDYHNIEKADYVSVVTPDATHHEIAKHFLRRGSNVLIEKPMTISLEEADQLFVLAKLYEKKLFVGHLERYNSEYLKAKQNISNVNGKNHYDYIKAWRSNNGKDYPRDNSDVVTDLMLHDIDLVLDLVGEEVKFIQAKGLRNGIGKHYFANARMVFANGTIADLTADRMSEEKRASMHVVGGGAGMKINFLEKKNDTLADELNDFIYGGYSNFVTARETLRVAFNIIKSIQ
jgi:predicted dehydrogenase